MFGRARGRWRSVGSATKRTHGRPGPCVARAPPGGGRGELWSVAGSSGIELSSANPEIFRAEDRTQKISRVAGRVDARAKCIFIDRARSISLSLSGCCRELSLCASPKPMIYTVGRCRMSFGVQKRSVGLLFCGHVVAGTYIWPHVVAQIKQREPSAC